MPLPELGVQDIKNYIDQIEKWTFESSPLLRSRNGLLIKGFEVALQQILAERAFQEMPRALPLIYSQLSVRPDLIAHARRVESIGLPMLGPEVTYDLQISGSTRWLMHKKSARLQTMVCLLLAEEGKLVIRDIYSDPVTPIVTPERRSNVDATIPSRSLRLITHIEASDAAVLGWVRVPIKTQKETESRYAPA